MQDATCLETQPSLCSRRLTLPTRRTSSISLRRSETYPAPEPKRPMASSARPAPRRTRFSIGGAAPHFPKRLGFVDGNADRFPLRRAARGRLPERSSTGARSRQGSGQRGRVQPALPRESFGFNRTELSRIEDELTAAHEALCAEWRTMHGMAVTEQAAQQAEKRMAALRENGFAVSARYDRRTARIAVNLKYGGANRISDATSGRSCRRIAGRPGRNRNQPGRPWAALAEARRRCVCASAPARRVRLKALDGRATGRGRWQSPFTSQGRCGARERP
jgi:hypothetical protein